jgi:hypothetical protein
MQGSRYRGVHACPGEKSLTPEEGDSLTKALKGLQKMMEKLINVNHDSDTKKVKNI